VSVQAIAKHVKVLRGAGLVSRTGASQRSPMRLEAEVLDLATAWIERARRRAEERYSRLDEVLAEMPDDVDPMPPPRRGAP
jgi:DNA-binding transcriptional ArsR family regulator